MSRFQFWETPVTKEFRDLVQSHYRFTVFNRPIIRMLDYILLQPWVDRNTGLTILSHPLCTEFRYPGSKTKSVKVTEMVKWFREELFDIELRNYSKDAHKAYQIEFEDFPDWLVDGLDAMLEGDPSLRCVGFVTGDPVDLKEWNRNRWKRLEGEMKRGAEIPNAIADYLNSLPQDYFDSLLDRFPRALALARELSDERKPGATTSSRASQLAALASVRLTPKPFYQQGSKSCRIHAAGYSLLSLKSEIRDELTACWMQIDLEHAELSIIAQLWNVPAIQQFLDSCDQKGIKVWQVFAEYCGLKYSDEVKKAIKPALYSTSYGMYPIVAEKKLSKKIIEDAAKVLMRHPVFKGIAEFGDKMADKFIKERTLTDAVGQTFKLEPDVKGNRYRQQAYSALASQEQSFEMAILAPVFKYAKATEQTDRPMWITAWLHDGLFIHCEPEFRDEHIGRIKEIVKQTSMELLGAELKVKVDVPTSTLSEKEILTLRSLTLPSHPVQVDFDPAALIPETD